MIMKKLFVILLAVTVSTLTLTAQNNKVNKVDFKHVKEVIENPKNIYYYPKLLQSFQSNDTTMTVEAYRNLYYGYTFQEDYNPFRESVYSNKVEQL